MALTVSAANPIRVVGTTDVAQAIHTGRESIYIKRVYWFLPATAGHLCTLKDKNGNFIVELACEADTLSRVIDIEQNVDDIYCDDMDSGTLYIYVR